MDMDAVLGFIRTVADVDMNKAFLEAYPLIYPPERVDRVADLVVVDGEIALLTPEHGTEGGFIHRVPDGTYPVYASGTLSSLYDEESERYRVNLLFIPLAEPERLTTPSWDWGYDGVAQELEDYACLLSGRSRRVTQDAPQNEAIARARKALLSDQARTRRDNWTNEVVDPETGANVLAFPVDYGQVCGFEARSEDGELLAILLVNGPH